MFQITQNINLDLNYSHSHVQWASKWLKYPVTKALLGKFWQNTVIFQIEITGVIKFLLFGFFLNMKVERLYFHVQKTVFRNSVAKFPKIHFKVDQRRPKNFAEISHSAIMDENF